MSALGAIVRKEIRDAIVSPRFLLSFSVTAVLLLLAFINGAVTYHRQQAQYEAARAANERRFAGVTEWYQVNETTTILPPTALSAIVPGLGYDIGMQASIVPGGEVRAQGSVYGAEPLFALFRVLDVEFACLFLLPLLCIVMAHDAICGERERATLRLLLSHPIPRDIILLGKAIGVLAVVVPATLLLFFLGVIIQIAAGIPFSGSDFLAILELALTAGIVTILWTSVAVLSSSLTRKAASSFLILLVAWVGFTLIWPRVSVLFAARMVDVPTREIASLERSKLASELAQSDRDVMANASFDEGGDPMAQFSKLLDSLGRERQKKLDALTEQYRLDREVRLQQQERFAMAAARISPAVATSLALQELAGTSLALPNAFEAQSRAFQTRFADFLSEKTGRSASGGRVVIHTIENGTEQKKPPIDVSEIPRFQFEPAAVPRDTSSIIISLTSLMVVSLAALAWSWRRFLRYDAR